MKSEPDLTASIELKMGEAERTVARVEFHIYLDAEGCIIGGDEIIHTLRQGFENVASAFEMKFEVQ